MRMQKLVTFFRQTFVATVLLGNLSLLLMPARVALANEDPNLIISAIQITGGTGHTQEDFVEFYNPTDLPFDLNGHRLVKRTAAGTTDTLLNAWSEPTVVLPHRFYLWANSSFATILKMPDASSTATLADNNGIALRQGLENLGEIIDVVAWGSTANGFPTVATANPAANTSLLREDLFSEQASFIASPSSPRNSSDEFLPELPPEPEPIPDPTPEPEPQPEPEPTPEPPPQQVFLKITELVPNPVGEDSGFEQIEIHNLGTQTVNLDGFVLDDIAATDELSSNSFLLPDTEIGVDEYLAITIPVGKFALNNTGGDVVTLFNKEYLPLDSAFYEETTPENMSWNYFSSGWAWAPLSLGEANGLPPEPEQEDNSDDEEDTEEELRHDNSGLVISEVYADPNSGEKEFLEIQNTGKETAELSEVELHVGTKHKLLPEQELESGEFYVVMQDQLPAQLRNSGQSLALKDGTETLDSVNYPKALKGSSYALFEDGYLWTTKLTKGEENILEMPIMVKEETSKVAEKTATKNTAKTIAKTSTKTTAKSSTKTTPKSSTSTTAKPASTQSADANPQILGESTKKPQNNSVGKIIAMGAAAVAAGVIALYKFVLSAGVE